MNLGFTITSPRQSVRQCSENISGTSWFRQQPKEFYAAGFQGLVK
jgi:phage terminase large subunit-like protein